MAGQPRPQACAEPDERIFRLHVAPFLGRLPITVLDKRAITQAVEKVRKATTDTDRDQRGLQATKALKLIRSFCGFAANKRDYIQRDPTIVHPGQPYRQQGQEG